MKNVDFNFDEIDGWNEDLVKMCLQLFMVYIASKCFLANYKKTASMNSAARSSSNKRLIILIVALASYT
jgi:hypothetical protein